MKTLRIKDKYNPLKIWIVKVSKCRHYYFNQEIEGKMHLSSFVRTTKKHLLEIGLNLNLGGN